MQKVDAKKADETDLRNFVDDNYYKLKVRSCEYYKTSYKDCKSFRGKFNQYFVFGEFLDCSQWKEDLENCKKNESRKDGDLEALANIIRHEDERKMQRVQANRNNDVWKRRDKPPSNWNAELPEWLKNTNKNSFPDIDESSSCIIF